DGLYTAAISATRRRFDERLGLLGIGVQAGPALAYGFLLRIAEHLRESRVDEPDPAFWIGYDDRIREILEDRAEQSLLPVQPILDRPLSGEIVNDTGEIALVSDRVLADRQVHGKEGAVPAQPLHLPADPDDPALPGLQISPNVSVVLARIGLRHQHGDVAASELLCV